MLLNYSKISSLIFKNSKKKIIFNFNKILILAEHSCERNEKVGRCYTNKVRVLFCWKSEFQLVLFQFTKKMIYTALHCNLLTVNYNYSLLTVNCDYNLLTVNYNYNLLTVNYNYNLLTVNCNYNLLTVNYNYNLLTVNYNYNLLTVNCDYNLLSVNYNYNLLSVNYITIYLL